MEQRTREFLNRIKSFKSKEEVESASINEVDQCKMSLQGKGYTFNTVEHTDELAGGQSILNRDLEETRYMEEIAHIKRGIISEWIAITGDQDRFNEIRDQVNDILFNLEL